MEDAENKKRTTRSMTAASKKRKDAPLPSPAEMEQQQQSSKKRKIDEENKAVAKEEGETERKSGFRFTYDDDAPISFIQAGPFLLAGTVVFKKENFMSAEADMRETDYVQSGVVINVKREDAGYNYERIRVAFKTHKRAIEFLGALVKMMGPDIEGMLVI